MSAAFDFLNGIFTSIIHGDIPHQEWLRDKLGAKPGSVQIYDGA